ncbi:MAG: magnesium transporter [Desulfovibrionaceae bacterium]
MEIPTNKESRIISSESIEGLSIEEVENTYHPEEIALYLHSLALEEQIDMLESLSPNVAERSFVELDQHVQSEIFQYLSLERSVLLVARMAPDDATDLLHTLDKDHVQYLLRSISPESAETIKKLMTFDSNTAGGIMNTEIVILKDTLSMQEAIQQIHRDMQKEKEIPYYAYVVNKVNELIGVLSLRDMLLLKASTKLREALSDKRVITLRLELSTKEVARQMLLYNFMALPVVDAKGRLLGAVTQDDVMDFIQEAAHENMLGMVGAGSDETVDTLWSESVRRRLPWLCLNLFTSGIAAYIILHFEESIAQMAILAVLMPIVANQSGNTGQQSLAVMLRQLSNENFDKRRAFFAVYRECKVGLTAGVAIACVASSVLFILQGSMVLSFVFGMSLMLDMLLGSFVGASIPLILRYCGRDPAQASSIFLTMFTDSVGFFVFLALATIFIL